MISLSTFTYKLQCGDLLLGAGNTKVQPMPLRSLLFFTQGDRVHACIHVCVCLESLETDLYFGFSKHEV